MAAETLDFQGEPLQGLQIMGMLESRNLDFETVILTSVNEGILPSGKSNNSFIPYDVKKAYGLPTHKEKDAVYTYHFYRLLQRAKRVYIIYNTASDVLQGGEKSRLIHQLLTDKPMATTITHSIASPKVQPTLKSLISVSKNSDLIARIAALATNGFSPTSLSTYIRNPIDFYTKYILRIADASVVEERIAPNTFGSVIHDTLEELYLPFIGSTLSEKKLQETYSQIKPTVTKHFSALYMETSALQGKNLIAFEVVARYVENFIRSEITLVKNHEIKILGLEQSMQLTLAIPELPFPVVLKGKIDRVDELDGVIRVIDYKTGAVAPQDVSIKDWADLITNYDKSKAFQLLCYSLLFQDHTPKPEFTAGIISFKSLSKGLFPFKEGRNSLITEDMRTSFFTLLKQLILEICNPNLPFIEKEV